jgi:hypothetical protein
MHCPRGDTFSAGQRDGLRLGSPALFVDGSGR